jgi:surface carbohydrate biosynthesis protein
LENKNVEIIAIRGEELNIYVVIKLLLSKKYDNNFFGYILTYIDIVSPKIIVTFVDNNPEFYILHNWFKDVVTVMIQNGHRSEELFLGCTKVNKNNSNFYVDHILCFSEVQGRRYNQYIFGKTLSIGSFINNIYPTKNLNSFKYRVVYISQYRQPSDNPNKPFVKMERGFSYTWKQYYSCEKEIVSRLFEYCLRNELEFVICGRSNNSNGKEKEYFSTLLGENNRWTFLANTKLHSSYKIIRRAYIVATIDSTLGLEALASGTKVAVFSSRNNIDDKAHDFGWPANVGKKGVFWTNNFSDSECIRIMDYLTTVERGEWDAVVMKYRSKVIEYDAGNTQFVNLMTELISQ